MSPLCGDDRRSSISEEDMPYGPIRGPVHKGEQDVHFPVYNPVDRLVGLVWTYCSVQMSSGHGFPPRQIDGAYNRPEKHFQQGVSIGDVGILATDGGFTFCFNIFASSDDPIQTSSLPRNFKPIEPSLSGWKIKTEENHFQPGTVIVSEGVIVRRVSESPLKLEFSSSSFDGAALVLPRGARRDDLVEVEKLYPYLQEHAADWYHFFNGYGSTGDELPSPPIMNGTIYVITGSDRALNYANASFPMNSESSENVQHNFTFDESHRDWWSQRGTAQCIARKEPLGKDNLVSVFYRGVTIALSPPLWLKHLPLIPINEVPCYSVPSTPSTGLLARIEQFLEARRGASKEALHSRMRIPFHPSTVLVQLLLHADPTADFALVHDTVWCSQMNEKNLTHELLPDLIKNIFDKNDISTDNGIVTFRPRGERDEENPGGATGKTLLYSLLNIWNQSPKTKATQAVPSVLALPGKEFRLD